MVRRFIAALQLYRATQSLEMNDLIGALQNGSNLMQNKILPLFRYFRLLSSKRRILLPNILGCDILSYFRGIFYFLL